MAAYYKVEVSLSTNSVTVGSPSAQEVLVTLPLIGPAGATGPAGAGAVESVNAQTGVVVLDASDVGAIAASVLTTQGDIVVRGASAPQRLALGNGAGKPLVVGASGPEWSVADSNFVLSQSVKISSAGTNAVNGVYLPTNSINGKASYIKDDYTISWDGASWNISANTTDYYTSTNDTSYPWQATTWTVDSGASPYPDVEQAAFSDMETVLGSKSYNTRTPSSTLAHASSHTAAGSDPIAIDADQVSGLDNTLSGAAKELRDIDDPFSGVALSFNNGAEVGAKWLVDDAPEFRTSLGLGTAATANLDALPETLRIVGGTDPTKKLAFDLDTLVDAATTRTLTVPNASGVIQLQSEVRSDFVTPYTYTGIAPAGTATSASAWKIRRSQYDSAGTPTATLTATNVKWDDRLTASYT